MTTFETFAKEIGVPLTTDEHGLYTGMARVLALICTQIIMDDPLVCGLEWEDIKPVVLIEFYKKFPYMKKTEDDHPFPAFPADYDPEEDEDYD